jgi:GT2 family glycosyltransferase
MFIPGTLRNKLGKFCEDYGVYGLWDSDYSIRAAKAGFENYYIPGLKSDHFGNDVGENSEYRKMKDESLNKALPIFSKNREKYEKGEVYI